MITCNTCGASFHKKPSKVRLFNYCQKACVNRSEIAKGRINIGEKNGNWRNASRVVTNRGYAKIKAHEHPRRDRDGYVLEHIVVVEKEIGRFLYEGEVVHHIDGNKTNNDIKNLKLYESHSQHVKDHAKQRRGAENAII